MPFDGWRFDELRSDYLRHLYQHLGSQGGESVTMAYISDAVRNKDSGGSTALLCGACDIGHADAND